MDAFTSQQDTAKIVKFQEEDDYLLVTAAVLVPEVYDLQGDIVSADEIKKAAHNFMEDSQGADFMHDIPLSKREAVLVESFRKRNEGPLLDIDSNEPIDGTDLPMGTWFVTYKVYSTDLITLIKSGGLTGFSIGGVSKHEAVAA